MQAGPSGRGGADAAPRRPPLVSREEHESVRQGLMRELAKLKATLASHKETAVQREKVCRCVDALSRWLNITDYIVKHVSVRDMSRSTSASRFQSK